MRQIRDVLNHLVAFLGSSRAILGPSGTILGPSQAIFRLVFAILHQDGTILHPYLTHGEGVPEPQNRIVRKDGGGTVSWAILCHFVAI